MIEEIWKDVKGYEVKVLIKQKQTQWKIKTQD